jgi:hypothetical protein
VTPVLQDGRARGEHSGPGRLALPWGCHSARASFHVGATRVWATAPELSPTGVRARAGWPPSQRPAQFCSLRWPGQIRVVCIVAVVRAAGRAPLAILALHVATDAVRLLLQAARPREHPRPRHVRNPPSQTHFNLRKDDTDGTPAPVAASPARTAQLQQAGTPACPCPTASFSPGRAGWAGRGPWRFVHSQRNLSSLSSLQQMID